MSQCNQCLYEMTQNPPPDSFATEAVKFLSNMFRRDSGCISEKVGTESVEAASLPHHVCAVSSASLQLPLEGRADEESLRARELVEYTVNTFTSFLMEVTVDGNPWSSDATGQKASPRLWIYLASLAASGR